MLAAAIADAKQNDSCPVNLNRGSMAGRATPASVRPQSWC